MTTSLLRRGGIAAVAFLLLGSLPFARATASQSASVPVLVRDINRVSNSGDPRDFTAQTAGHGRELWRSDGTAAGTVMVKDIASGSTGSDPIELVVVGNTLFFRADDGTHGDELWKSDGTAAGTVMVKDIFAGFDQWSSPNSGYPQRLIDVNGELMFSAADANGQELWKSDGTAAGTTMVKDINSAGDSYPQELVAVGNTLFFQADNGTNGDELWKSDGTSAGTVMVKDIRSGGDGRPQFLVEFNGAAYFRANDGINGSELWKSDGTSAGTTMVKDIRPGSSGSSPSEITNVAGTLYFQANDGTNRAEPWKSDGTSAGTVMVKDVWPGSTTSNPQFFFAFGSRVIFRAETPTYDDEMWISDGTEAGTFLVKDINTTTVNSNPVALTPVGNSVYFVGDDGTTGQELWFSDGTESGTRLVKDVCPGGNEGVRSSSDADYESSSRPIVQFGAGVMFRGNNCQNGEELWVSDGTSAGTTMVTDLNTDGATDTIKSLTRVGSLVLFFHESSSHGWELWKSDGTAAGTVLVKDINAGSGSSIFGSTESRQTYVFNNEMYFMADDGVNGGELWKTDGTESGTVMVKDITAGSAATFDQGTSRISWTTMGSIMYFVVNYANFGGWALWKTDGTEAGTQQVSARVQGYGLQAMWPTVVGSTVYFVANDGVNGGELWKSDGTLAGTSMVKDINVGSGSGVTTPSFLYNPLMAFDGELYFAADDGSSGFELWKSDGTAAGTVLVADVVPGSSGRNPRRFTVFGGSLYFTGMDSDGNGVLWRLNGATAEKVEFEAGQSSSPQWLTVAGNRLFMSATTVRHGSELRVWPPPASSPPNSNSNVTTTTTVTPVVMPVVTPTTRPVATSTSPASSVRPASASARPASARRLPETGGGSNFAVLSLVAVLLGCASLAVSRSRGRRGQATM